MSLKPLKETVELWQRINNATNLEESLSARSMSSFLILEDSAEAIDTLNNQIDQAMTELKALNASAGKAGMPNTEKALQKAIADVATLRLKPSPKIKIFDLGSPVKKASKVMANASSLSATIVSAGQTLMKSMNDYDLDITSTEPLESVLNAAREASPDKNIPDTDVFASAVKRSWKPPKGVGNAIKGFLGSIGLGGGTNFFGLTAELFAEDLLAAPPSKIMEFLKSGPAKDAGTVDDKELAGLDDKLAADGLDKEKIAAGDKEAKGEDGAPDATGESDAKKWSDLSAAYLKTVDDTNAGKKFLDALKGNEKFVAAVSNLINLEESMYRTSLSSLLFEKVEFDILKSAAAAATDNEGSQLALAKGLAKVLADQGIDVNNIPGKEEEVGDPDAPVDAALAEEEQALAQAELQQAVKDEASQDQSPVSAALGAIDSWVDGLSATSQKSLQAKKRVDSLKQVVQTSLDTASSAVEKQVVKAIQKWRAEHEETLMKSRRFAKKNFDTLQQLVPKLAGAMLKKSNEAHVVLTTATVNKTVYSFLNKKFYSEDNLLSEALISPPGNPDSFNSDLHDTGDATSAEDDMVRYRWLRMAGLGN